MFGGIRFEPEHQGRLSVRRPHEPPPPRGPNPHAVDVDHFLDRERKEPRVLGGALKKVLQPIHDPELRLVGTVDADLGGDLGGRQAGRQRGHRLAGLDEELHHPARRVDRIVVPVVAVAEEEMAAHLPGQRRVEFLHARFDQGMAGLPHHRPPTEPSDFVVEHLRALRFRDHRRAGVRRQDGAGQERQQTVSPEDVAPLVDHPETIGVAVVGDPHVGASFLHRGDQIAEVVEHGGIRMVMGKSRVRFAVQLDDVAPDGFQ